MIGNYQTEQGKKTFAEISCKLEIRTNKEAYLIFLHQSTLISQKSLKEVWKAFSLSKPKIIAYSIAFPIKNLDVKTTVEEDVLNLGKSAYVKAHHIFYYDVLVDQRLFQQQIIEMKYYPKNILNIINSGPSIQTALKFQYSIQFMHAIVNLHKQGIIHRNIKPENILIDEENNLVLTDFGSSCYFKDKKILRKKDFKSLCYVAPEVLKDEDHNHGSALDIWSAGCVLWMLWKNEKYPWYEEACKAEPNLEEIFNKIKELEKSAINPQNPIEFLLKNMLKRDPKMRWFANRCVNEFNFSIKPFIYKKKNKKSSNKS